MYTSSLFFRIEIQLQQTTETSAMISEWIFQASIGNYSTYTGECLPVLKS